MMHGQKNIKMVWCYYLVLPSNSRLVLVIILQTISSNPFKVIIYDILVTVATPSEIRKTLSNEPVQISLSLVSVTG